MCRPSAEGARIGWAISFEMTASLFQKSPLFPVGEGQDEGAMAPMLSPSPRIKYGAGSQSFLPAEAGFVKG